MKNPSGNSVAGQPNKKTDLDIIDLVMSRYPNAAEVHVQIHTHLVRRIGVLAGEGHCICSVEGRDVRRQYTDETPDKLYHRVKDDIPDWQDITDMKKVWEEITPH